MKDKDFTILEQTIRQDERNKVIEEVIEIISNQLTPHGFESDIQIVEYGIQESKLKHLAELRTKLNQLKGGKMNKKYLFMGMVLSDGDTFEVQEEKPNTNPYNPSGIGVATFHHKKYKNVRPYFKQKKTETKLKASDLFF